MKRIILICSFFTVSYACLAQNDCNNDHPIFNFSNSGHPKVVRELGSSPEFPALRNLSTRQQVLAAMKNEKNGSRRGRRELNNMLEGIGFDNGVKDVKLSSIRPVYLPNGTTGNMGSGSYNSSYTKLSGNTKGYKAWKITSDKGCYMYILAKCGNAFAVNTANKGRGSNKTACLEVPVNITTEPKVIRTETTAAKAVDEKKVYIYYHEDEPLTAEERYARRHIPDDNPSAPLLLRSTKNVRFVPKEYTVTVTPAEDRVKVCPDKPVDISANINVEKSSAYTGKYAGSSNKVYKEVCKSVYNKAARKMRKAKRKEEKVSEMTDIDVNR
jgi:hypothetical protein